MISYDEALAHVRARARPLGDETVTLAQACGRVLARDVTSTVALPRFASSAMDGFAVRGVHETYRVVGRVLAGEDAQGTLQDGEAIEVMTGAPLPGGTTAIARVEDTTREGERVRVAAAGEYLRPAGEDYAPGALVLRAGTRLTPAALMAAAAVGHGSLRVRRVPRIAVIPTGNELVNPGEPLQHPAHIWNSSAVYLQTALPGVTVHPIVRDDPAAFVFPEADIIVTTGAVSMGQRDFIPSLVLAQTVFHKVAIKPGKPILFADLGERVFFGLPGNPISTAVGARFFVTPLIRRMLGLSDETGELLPLAQPVKNTLLCFYKAHRNRTGVTVLRGQGSHLIRPLVEANCWAVVQEGTHALTFSLDP